MLKSRKDLRLYLIVVVAVVIYSLYSFAAQKAEWRKQMANLLSALTDLVPEMMSDDKDSNERFKIKSKKLIEVTAKLDSSKPHGAAIAPDNDPALKYLSKLFYQDMKRMDAVIKEGHVPYAKSLARSSVAYCIACHTRTSAGSQFSLMKAFEANLKSASPNQRIHLFAATRQYDAAYNEAMSYFRDENVDAGAQNKIAQIGLMVAVRAKESPERGLLFAQQVQRSAVANDFLKSKAAQWVDDLRVWQKEASKPLKTDAALIEAARKLMSSESDATGVKNLGSEVRHLRASTLMHQLLRDFPESSHTAEALFLIGNSYDVMGDLGYWNLGETYFEACIDKAPHTAQAERCFERYKDSVIFGYSGSSGIHLPGAVQRHLNDLENKSKRISKVGKSNE